jgi:chaperonin GroES
MNLKPLNNNLIVKPAVKEEVTKSGLVLADTGRNEKPEKGEVIAVGEGKLSEDGVRQKMTVKVGDKVMFKKYGPDEIEVEGEKFLVLSENDILAIIE